MTIAVPPSDPPLPDSALAATSSDAQLPLSETGWPAVPGSAATQIARIDARLGSAIAYLRAHEARNFAPHRHSTARVRQGLQRIALGLLAGGIAPAPEPEPSYPRISVIVTEGDPAATIATIESVAVQRYQALELILVGSPGTLFSYEPLAAELIDRPTGDRIAAQAAGLARATGDLFAILTPGDLMLPGTLDRVGRHWEQRRHDGLIRSAGAIAVNSWRLAASLPDDRLAGIFIHRLAYDAAGGLDATLGDAAWPGLLQAVQVRFGGSTLPGHAVLAAAEPVGAAPRRPGRLDFTVAAGEALPAIGPAQRPLAPARCPVSGGLPHVLLFSSPDTRTGDPGMSDLWYHPDSHCVALAAPAEPSGSPPRAEPGPDDPSPFRHWQGTDPMLRWAGNSLPSIFAHLVRSGWDDPTPAELLRLVKRPAAAGPIRRALDIGCGSGAVLDALKAQGWHTSGAETDEAAIEQARAKGHQIWACGTDDILRAVPPAARFELIFLGHQLELQADPLATVQRLARLLEPDGALIVATPNLDSAQIDRFGPTWAHWAPPLHRFVFSRQTLAQMAAASGLALTKSRSFSHPYWSWMSLRLNSGGLMGVVAGDAQPDETLAAHAECLAAASRLFYDWRGQGDYLYAVLQPNLKG